MMSRESLLSSLKGLSKNVYSREELLPEMDLLEEEMAQIVFEDGLDIPSEYVHMSYIMKRLHIMNNEAGNVADQELKRLLYSQTIVFKSRRIIMDLEFVSYLDYLI